MARGLDLGPNINPTTEDPHCDANYKDTSIFLSLYMQPIKQLEIPLPEGSNNFEMIFTSLRIQGKAHLIRDGKVNQ